MRQNGQRRGREIGEHMKECIRVGEGEIDWDGEVRGWRKRGGSKGEER